MFRVKIDTETLFKRAEKYFWEILLTCSKHPASDALQKAYKEITGLDPWLLTGKKHRSPEGIEYETYAETEAYKKIKDPLLKRLNQKKGLILHLLEAKESGDINLNTEREAAREGADNEKLRDIGYIV